MKALSVIAHRADDVSMQFAAWLYSNRKALIVASVVTFLLLAAMTVSAGVTGVEFQGIYNKIKDWVGGYLGKSIALFAFLLGLGFGAARQSPIPAIVGIVFALFIAFGPTIIEGIATATI